MENDVKVNLDREIKCKIGLFGRNLLSYISFYSLFLIIILPKTVQLFGIVLLSFLFYQRVGARVFKNRVSQTILVVFIVHLFAILINVAFFDNSNDRIFASLNTASLWFFAAIFYGYYHINQNVNLIKISKICFFNIFLLFILACVSCYLYYVKSFESFALFNKTLFETVYLSGRATIKFIGLNDYSNMNLIFIMIMFLMSSFYLRRTNLIKSILAILMSSFEVFLIHSRSGMILFTLSIVWYLISLMKMKNRKIIFHICIILIPVLVAVFWKDIYNIIFNKIIYGNESSTSLRIELLRTSFFEALNTSPIWGMGVKRFLYDGYPLGSHSTYIGLFYKTGIIGLLFGLLAFYFSNKSIIIKEKKSPRLFFYICLLVLFAIEDIDGCNWCIILYFSVLSLINNKLKGEYYD